MNNNNEKNNVVMSVTGKVNYQLKINDKSKDILKAYSDKYIELNPATKQTDNDIRFKLCNELLNMVKTAQLSLNNLKLSLIDNKLQGKNKTDFTVNKDIAGEYLNQILLTGKVTIKNNEDKDINCFLKGLRYYNTAKKTWFMFIDKENWKSIDNKFSNYKNNLFIYKNFMFDNGAVTKVSLKDINKR